MSGGAGGFSTSDASPALMHQFEDSTTSSTALITAIYLQLHAPKEIARSSLHSSNIDINAISHIDWRSGSLITKQDDFTEPVRTIQSDGFVI